MEKVENFQIAKSRNSRSPRAGLQSASELDLDMRQDPSDNLQISFCKNWQLKWVFAICSV